MVKVWNVADGDGGKPSVSMVASRDLGVVSCFSLSFFEGVFLGQSNWLFRAKFSRPFSRLMIR